MRKRGRPPRVQPVVTDTPDTPESDRLMQEESELVSLVLLRRQAIKAGHTVDLTVSRETLTALTENDDTPEPASWEWENDSTISARATDSEGNYEACIGINGDVRLTHFAHPNLKARRPGQRLTTDEHFTIECLDEFLDLLQAFRDEGYPKVENLLEALAESEQKRIEAINAESARHGQVFIPTPEEQTILDLGKVYGFALSGEPLLYALADALGIPKQEKKQTGSMLRNSDEVRADILAWAAAQEDTSDTQAAAS